MLKFKWIKIIKIKKSFPRVRSWQSVCACSFPCWSSPPSWETPSSVSPSPLILIWGDHHTILLKRLPGNPQNTNKNSFLIRFLIRKLSNMFLVSLAIADLLVAIFVMPFAIVNDMQVIILNKSTQMEMLIMSCQGHWWLGHTACKLWIRWNLHDDMSQW